MLNTSKLSSFASGPQRKSKYQRDKEAAELKRKQEEEEAARAYAEFVDAFEGDASAAGKGGRAGGKSFVRASGSSAGLSFRWVRFLSRSSQRSLKVLHFLPTTAGIYTTRSRREQLELRQLLKRHNPRLWVLSTMTR
jgi:hypothetical protein